MQKSRMYGILGFSTIILVITGVSIISLINPIKELDVIGPTSDFTLPSIDGTDYTFSGDEGKVRVVTFLYTKCTAGCGVLATKMGSVWNHLIEDGMGDDIKFISIDFDFLFDNMTDLTEYAHLFTEDTSRWQWLLGDQNQTEKVTDEWNFYYEWVNMTEVTNTDTTDEHAEHEVVYTHIFAIYIVDQEGNFRKIFYGLLWENEELYNTVEFLIKELEE